jgi:RNA-directed DNA polymerase
LETLRTAYRLAKGNDGAPGIDGVTFDAIEAAGADGFLAQLRDELVTFRCRPLRNRQREIPMEGTTNVRLLSIPAIRDRVVQAVLPFVDDFLPARTLTNLADLAIHLNALV